MPNEATTMDIEVYDVMMDMTQTEKPPRLYEGEVTPLPALGDWETLALTGTQIEGARSSPHDGSSSLVRNGI